MGRFNLLDEAWIPVIIDDKGNSKEVSLKDLYKNAHRYKDLAGDTRTQDFVVLRVLLAGLFTVFSRYDDKGVPYEYLEVDNKFRQIDPIDEEDVDFYIDDMLTTWENIWDKSEFPSIIDDYLEAWRDRFNLYDDKYPFFQVTAKDLKGIIDLNGTKAMVHAKNINRKLSESANKTALFAYKNKQTKEILSDAEIVRWLLTYQSYSGTGDKAKFPSEARFSKGWLYDIGGLYLKGDNLFETLMLNWSIDYKVDDNSSIQQPCWELSSEELIKNYLEQKRVNNIATLYTNWSRGIYIDPEHRANTPFSFRAVKLPEIEHADAFIEPMTIWRYHEKGDFQDKCTPQKHKLNESMWRSFGLIAQVDKQSAKGRMPGIIEWVKFINKNNEGIERNITLVATSMQDDGNATSWVPVDEIVDTLSISNFVLTDLQEDGWVIRINDVVDLTKSIVDVTYKLYIQSIQEIRNVNNSNFVNQRTGDLYYKIDDSFRRWLSNIRVTDTKEAQIKNWKTIIEKAVKDQAKEDVYFANTRDYMGIEKDGEMFNIANAYNKFNYFLNKQLNS